MFYKNGNIGIQIEKVLTKILTKFVDIFPFLVFTVMELETSVKNMLLGLPQKSDSHSKSLCPWQCLRSFLASRRQ